MTSRCVLRVRTYFFASSFALCRRGFNFRRQVVVLGLILAFVASGMAQTNPLHFFKNYFVTGDYALGGKGLRGQGSAATNNLASGTINMSGVPANADVVAAFLYWEELADPTVISASTLAAAKFRGFNITGTLVSPTNPYQPACWSSGGGAGTTSGAVSLFTFRADVLRYLPYKTDSTGKPISGRLVNDADLTNAGFSLTNVSVPDSGGGGGQSPSSSNQAFLNEGVTLLVVYRTQTDPLRAVVIYDGGYTFNQDTAATPLVQTIRGFYQASSVNPQAKISYLVGDGDKNFTEQLFFANANNVNSPTLLAANPFTGALGFDWDNPTYNVSSLMLGNDSFIQTKLTGGNQSSVDCVSFDAIAFSTTVQDTDGDGLLDVWESTSGLTDPNNNPLPDIHAMGANPFIRDLFVEIDYMTAASHSHLPSQAVLDNVGAAFKKAPPLCFNSICAGINVHFDIGNNYQGGATPDPFIIQATQGAIQGGEAIAETACAPGPQCIFPDYPGTVGWKMGFVTIKNGDPNAIPQPLPPHFDHLRKDMFHYAVMAHTLAFPRWLTLDGSLVSVSVLHSVATVTLAVPHNLVTGPAFISISGAPATANVNGVYNNVVVTSPKSFTVQIPAGNNAPDFPPVGSSSPGYQNWGLGVGNGVPRSNSGISDILGGDLMLTLGRWDNSVGSDFMQASTLMHELGHNLGLGHAGALPDTDNCKPNYPSTMSYMFQVDGLLDLNGVAHIDFSGSTLPSLPETNLSEPLGWLNLTTLPYLTRWYSPVTALSNSFSISPATKHCNGTPILDGAQMVRVDGSSLAPPIDWSWDGIIQVASISSQDVNFSGGMTSTPGFAGFNDWANLKPQQLGARRNGFSFSLDIDLPEDTGDEQLGSLINGDTGSLMSSDTGSLINGDTGSLINGDTGSLMNSDTGSLINGDTGRELDLETAAGSGGNAPSALIATATKFNIDLTWTAPHLGTVLQYLIFRGACPKVGVCSIANSSATLIGTTGPAGNNCDGGFMFCDTTTKNGVLYLYFVEAKSLYPDGTTSTSGPSNAVKKSR